MPTTRPRTIQIYLPEGDPRGVRVAALTTSIVQVVEVPRAMLDQFQDMPQARQVGVYFLVGDDAERDLQSLYIGQTGLLGKRLNEHHLDRRKDFWSRALVTVSLTHSLTQTHALFIEYLSIKHANEAARYAIENGTAGSRPHAPPPLEADCHEIFETMRTLLATLGQPIFEPLAIAAGQSNADDYLYCRTAGSEAVGQYTGEGMVVLKGSRARFDIAPSMANMSAAKRRAALIAEGLMRLEGDSYVFAQDVLFTSPSGASDVVAGSSTNGWTTWKTQDGRTLDELKRVIRA